jgi:hypothetical protein
MKTLLLIALLPLAAEAQLVMYAVGANNSETIVAASTYNFGQIPLNVASNAQFRVYNTGSAAVSVNVTLGGAGFAIDPLALPYTIPAHSTATETLNMTVHFTPSSTAAFSASLQVGSLSVILLGSGVTAPTLKSVSGCSASFDFGNVVVGNSTTCTFSLQNLNPQAITVPSIVVNGLGFTGPYGVTAPLVLQPGQSASLSVNFTPPGGIPYSGTITIGPQSFSISGAGLSAVIPTPSLQFDSAPAASAQQRTLTMTIPGGSPIAVTGYVNLAFTPSTPVVKDDTSIAFLANGSRVIPFTVSAGATQALLGGLGSATFQTGTTEGIIVFTVTTNAGLAGDPTVKLAIPGSAIIIDSSSASKQRLGFLDIAITGADNTYTAGSMAFTFFDTNGNPIANSSADFTGAFKTYYGGQTGGSAFSMLVAFPVNGSVAGIGSVKVTLSNAATLTTQTLTFP